MKNLILFIIISLLVYSSYCKRKGGKKKDTEKYKTLPNVCDEEDRERPVMCYCTPDEPNTALEATCWVYMEKLDATNPVWETFESQTMLEKLKFNIRPGGTLLSIPTNALKFLKHLQILEIQYAHISELTSYVFSNLSSITEISLSRNQIGLLHGRSIAHMPKLTMINLDENRISEVKRNVFVDVPNLKKLYIDRNNLSIIHDYAFEHLNRLEDLELNGNQISIATKETFNGLKSLKRLELRSNRLTMIGDYTFAELPVLEELDLDQNKIEFISDNAFAGLYKLSKLRLSENSLKSLSDELFKEATNIFLLDLRSNGLELLSRQALEPIWSNLKNSTSHILLDRNRLKCDCHLSWVYSLRNETNNIEIRNALDELTCVAEGLDFGDGSASILATEKPQMSEDQEAPFDVNAVQYDDEDIEYDEEVESADYDSGPVGPPRKHVFEIPMEKLPCPEMQKAATEDIPNSNVFHLDFNSSSQLKCSLYLLSISILRTVFSR